MAIKKGDVVTVDYEGRLENGEVFDTSYHKDHSHPLTFEVGAKKVIPGFDAAVVGMKKGEEKEVIVQPEHAYGKRNEKMVQKLPKSKLPKGQEPKPGYILMLKSEAGHNIPATITEVTDTEITVDVNHPLAGKTLIFKIKVVDIQGE
jgi:peptidylprolyl isomerase